MSIEGINHAAGSSAEAIREAMSVGKLLTPERPTPAPEMAASTNTSASTELALVAPDSSNGITAPPDAPPSPTIKTYFDTEVDVSDVSEANGSSDTGGPVTAAFQREFVCMNDEFSECKTGQYTLDLSRKVISDHFGRNKASTRLITDWPLFCRKHYQRATYNGSLWQLRKISLILRQFDVIENQHPGTTYDVVLKKSEEARLNDFSRKVAGGMDHEEAAVAVAPSTGKHFEAPINVLRELEFGLGRGKDLDDVKNTVNLILDMLKNDETKQVPSIEFLPQIPGKVPVISPKTKIKAKAKTGTSSRVSAKGAVKKTTKKA